MQADAAEYRARKAAGEYDFPYFGSVAGGTAPAAVAKGLEVKFDRDMHAYREARRSGEEQPDMVSQEAVFKAQRWKEREEAMKEEMANG